MTDQKQYSSRQYVAPLADILLGALQPACERIEIAGSLRRNAQASADIELVAIPRITPRQRGLFAEVELPEDDETDLDRRIQGMIGPAGMHEGMWIEFDQQLPRNGSRYKRLRMRTDGTVRSIAVDLFCVRPPAQWGPILAIRTGPAEFSRILVTPRRQGGAMPDHLQLRDGALKLRAMDVDVDATLPTPDEKTFFEALGVPHWYPHERTAEGLIEFLNMEVKRAGVIPKT